MIALKPGVSIKGMQPQLALGLSIAEGCYSGVMTVTSVTDGTHMPTSLHYKGLAADLRTSDQLPETVDIIVQNLKSRLGAEWDVVRESDHLHIEHDPKS